MKTTTLATVLVLVLVMAYGAGMSYAALSGPTPIPNPPSFHIISQPMVLCKGDTNYIPITVTNDGTRTPSIGTSNPNGAPMQDVELQVQTSRDLIPAGNGTAVIGSLNPSNSATVYLPVFVNQSAPLIDTVGISITYYYLIYYADSETRNLTFETAQCPSQLSVNMTPKTLISGQIQNVTVKLRNSGNTTLTDLNVHWSLPAIDGAVVGSQQTNIAALTPGSIATANASIFVSRNASIESFPINITATFYNNGTLEQVLNSTSIVPTGAINLHPSGITLSPSTVPPGGIFSISFVLTDIGTSGASATSAYATLPQNFSAYGSNPVYVGDIAADTQAPVTLTLTADSHTKEGTYTIPIKISYLNGLRQNQTEMMNVSVNITTSNATLGLGSGYSQNNVRVSNSGGGGSGILVLVLFVALIAFIWLYYNERKKNSKQKGH